MATVDEPSESSLNEVDPARLFDYLLPAANPENPSQTSEVKDTNASQSASTASKPTPRVIDSVLIESFFNRLMEGIKMLPPSEAKPLLDMIAERVQAARASAYDEAPPLPQSGFKRFAEAARGVNPYDWLKENWGRWLKHFHPELKHNHLFLDQLGALDPELKKALYAKRRAIKSDTGLSISQIVPKKSERLDMEIADLDEQEIRRAVSAYVLPKSRKRRHSK